MAHRASEYSNNFAEMESFLYLCFFTLIASTYTIPADSEYIGILVIFNVNFVFIIHAAKTCCIVFVFYGETFVYQNCGETVLCRGKRVFIRTSADKRVCAVIYNLFLSPVISRLIENND